MRFSAGNTAREYVDLLFDTYPLAELPVETMPELSEDDLSIATGCARVDIGMYAQEGEEPLFTGKFWLLVGPRVYSASEMFTVFAKYTGFATIVGERTGGDGISMQPLVRALPNTGICLKYTAMLGLNPDGHGQLRGRHNARLRVPSGDHTAEVPGPHRRGHVKNSRSNDRLFCSILPYFTSLATSAARSSLALLDALALLEAGVAVHLDGGAQLLRDGGDVILDGDLVVLDDGCCMRQISL